jgi:C-terminal processing protease CtpA/Prc
VYTLPGRATTHTATLLGIDFPTVRRCLAPDPTPPYTFARRAGVGIITMHRMAQPQRFNRFLARVADSLEQRPAEGLIVDLRPCPGGRTRVARLVVGALTDVPFRLVARKDWKVSAAYKAFLRARAGPQHPYLRQPEGRVVSVKYKATAPPDPPLRYRGPVAVLVGPRTFSGAVTLAATLKANGRAAIVGRETGGRVHRFGEGYTFRLPHTGLRAMVSSAYFEHASRPRDWSGGLVPDIMVDAPLGTESDVALGVALARMRRLATTP